MQGFQMLVLFAHKKHFALQSKRSFFKFQKKTCYYFSTGSNCRKRPSEVCRVSASEAAQSRKCSIAAINKRTKQSASINSRQDDVAGFFQIVF
jgi:hypothetical protein